MNVRVKVALWKSVDNFPEDASKEYIINHLKSGEAGINSLFDEFDSLSYMDICETEYVWTPEDNEGESTIELFDDDCDDPIWTNARQ